MCRQTKQEETRKCSAINAQAFRSRRARFDARQATLTNCPVPGPLAIPKREEPRIKKDNYVIAYSIKHGGLHTQIKELRCAEKQNRTSGEPEVAKVRLQEPQNGQDLPQSGSQDRAPLCSRRQASSATFASLPPHSGDSKRTVIRTTYNPKVTFSAPQVVQKAKIDPNFPYSGGALAVKSDRKNVADRRLRHLQTKRYM